MLSKNNKRKHNKMFLRVRKNMSNFFVFNILNIILYSEFISLNSEYKYFPFLTKYNILNKNYYDRGVFNLNFSNNKQNVAVFGADKKNILFKKTKINAFYNNKYKFKYGEFNNFKTEQFFLELFNNISLKNYFRKGAHISKYYFEYYLFLYP
jgi:hypothetical protein